MVIDFGVPEVEGYSWFDFPKPERSRVEKIETILVQCKNSGKKLGLEYGRKDSSPSFLVGYVNFIDFKGKSVNLSTESRIFWSIDLGNFLRIYANKEYLS